MKFMCMPCSFEYQRYTQEQLQQVAESLSQEEQLAAIRALRKRADKHMKQWISKRGSK
jgi:hypothetical protein